MLMMVNEFLQVDRINVSKFFSEMVFNCLIERGRVDQALRGRTRRAIVTDITGADLFLREQFKGWTEEVAPEVPSFVEALNYGEQVGVRDTLITEELADMNPVLLFNIGVVIFMIGAGSRELDGRLAIAEIMPKVMIEEFAAVIDVEAQDGERQMGFHVSDRLGNVGIAFIPDGAGFGPLAKNISHSNAPDEVAFDRIAAMRHRIGLEKARGEDIAMGGADRDLQFK